MSRAVQPWTASAAVEQGLDLAAQVGATAAEAVRSRRDPALVAARRQRAARRRLRAWSAATVVTVGGGVGLVALAGGLSAPVIVALVFLSLILAFCVVRGVRSAGDLRARTRLCRALPPPSPRRSAVAGPVRPTMARLDGYSDGLRRLMTMVGLTEDGTVLALRDDVIRSADATEYRLRARAGELSELLRARRRADAEVGGGLDVTIAGMTREVEDGVAAYGRLVAAANDAVDATRGLAGAPSHRALPGSAAGTGTVALPRTAGSAAAGAGAMSAPDHRATAGAAPELVDPIDRLRALAAGMRELTG